MTHIIDAIFDGEVFRPEKPIHLDANTKVRVLIDMPEPPSVKRSFLDTALANPVEGPPDWSENLDRYLYGVSRSTA